MQSGVSKCTIQSNSSSVRSLSFSSDGRFLVSGGDDGYIRVWDLVRGVLASSFHAHSAGISSVIFSCNNQAIVSSGWDKTVKIWIIKTAIPKFFNIRFFTGLFSDKQNESASSLPSFILQQAQESQRTLIQDPTSSIKSDAYSFKWENINIPARNPQLSLVDWERRLKEWKRKEEEQKKEQRAKERLRLREENLKLEKKREERLRKEHQLKEEKLKQEQQVQQEKRQQQKTFWENISSSTITSDKNIRVQGYRRSNGTYVKAHNRKKS